MGMWLTLSLSLSKRRPAMSRGTSLERRNGKWRTGTAHSPKQGDKLLASFSHENNNCDHVHYTHTLLRLPRRSVADEQSRTNSKLSAGWQKVFTASWWKGWMNLCTPSSNNTSIQASNSTQKRISRKIFHWATFRNWMSSTEYEPWGSAKPQSKCSHHLI
jgi:hypothetical protein